MYISYLTQLCAVFMLGLMGCTATRDVAWPEPRPLGEAIPAYRPPAEPLAEPSYVASQNGDSTLTLREAVGRTLLYNPDLRMFAWEVRAREARMLQAGLFPNPEIGGEVENFNGTGGFDGFGAAEVTFGLSQLDELGGDRWRRKQVAAGERNLAGWDYETVRLDVELKRHVQACSSSRSERPDSGAAYLLSACFAASRFSIRCRSASSFRSWCLRSAGTTKNIQIATNAPNARMAM